MELIIKDTAYDKNVLLGGTGDDEKLVVPNHVTVITEQAFGGMDVMPGLKEVVFEPGGHIEISLSAFMYSNLVKVDFSDSVEIIREAAFEKCTKLKEVVFGKNLTRINAAAFLDDKQIETLELPEGLEIIESQAFQGCKGLKRLIIPNSVSEIGNGAFNKCDSLEDLQCNSDNLDRFFDSFNAKNKPKMILEYLRNSFKCTSIPGKKTIAYIEKNQNKILDMAVAEDDDITVGALIALPIKINESYMEVISKKASAKVRGVLLDYENRKDSVNQEDNLLIPEIESTPKTLAEWKKVFRLTNIGDKEICVGPYKGYETSISVPEMIGKRTVTKLEETFSEKPEVTNVYLPESLKEIGYKTFAGCSQLMQISLPRKLQTIGGGAFRGCIQLIEIEIPEKVKVIKGGAFDGCAALKTIAIPDSVKEIGTVESGICIGSTFEGCTNLEEIKLSSKLKRIPDCAFRGCSLLKRVVLPEKTKEIGGFAFNGCSNLEKIFIPETVKSISVDYVFGGCNKLTIQTEKGSYAEEYAIRNGISVEIVE